MATQLQLPSYDDFSQWVGDALRRLYDAAALQASPLAAVFDDERGPTGRSQRLRRLLLDAIRALQPAPGVPADSRDWRCYRLLELRYIEGLSPEDAMDQLGLGRSQFFRDQAQALEALNAVVWEAWRQVAGQAAQQIGETSEHARLVRSEAERLHGTFSGEGIELCELLTELRPLIESLAHARGITVQLDLASATQLPGERVLLRQVVLHVCMVVLALPGVARIAMGSLAMPDNVGLLVEAQVRHEAEAAADTFPNRTLEEAGEIMAAMGGVLRVQRQERYWRAQLLWPTTAQRTLLVIDDNQGMVALFRRYLMDSTWQVIGAASGAEAQQVIEREAPTLIVLDVLMPKEDGWDLMVALHQDQRTCRIPVVICSVLTQPQLALTLGAAAYLAKPVSQAQLLDTLRTLTRLPH